MTKTEIIAQYELVKEYHTKFLAQSGVSLPKLWTNDSKTSFTKDAIVLAALSRGYPNCQVVSKNELTSIMREYYPETNDVQQARHLGRQKGWYIESGTRGDLVSQRLRSGEYLLKTLEEPYPGFTHERREVSADFDALKKSYDYKCACCGSEEGHPHRYIKNVTTVLQKGHMDPAKPLTPENTIPQCEIFNRPDRNWWIYDKYGRVIGIGNAYVIKRCSPEMKKEIFEMLKKEFGA